MLELGTYGSVRGALSNERPYRDPRVKDARLLTMRSFFLLSKAKIETLV